MEQKRCKWAQSINPKMVEYHDIEWGVPVLDDRKLFEFLVLEGAQAGLSWETILNKREGYRGATYDFDFKKIVLYGLDSDSLMHNEKIIRNRLKILSIKKNAHALMQIIETHGSFTLYLWKFTKNKPIQNTWQRHSAIPTVSPEAIALSKDLKKHGFTFVGPTICYAFMQAIGMVNDHTTDCFRHREVQKMGTTIKL